MLTTAHLSAGAWANDKAMDEWRPGSFTKNYSWGPTSDGLKRLHETIKQGFEGRLEPVTRNEFRQRILGLGRPDYIPLNFFLFNEIRNGVNYVVVDELVFQALTFRHGSQFDKLALYAFNLSIAGHWSGAASYQSRPALWAKHYVAERVGRDFDWNANRVSANDIETFVTGDDRYTGQTARKLSTNLNYLFHLGRLRELLSKKPERWWLSSIFLTLDRTVGAAEVEFGGLGEARLLGQLAKAGFWTLSGRRSAAKDIAAAYYVALYAACGGRLRFSGEAIVERERTLLPNQASNQPPEAGAVGVFHPTDPTARNAIPHACRVLARYLAGFEVFEVDEIDDLQVETYIRERTVSALLELQQRGVKPKISADDLTKLMREE